jgi:hypothetical protein
MKWIQLALVNAVMLTSCATVMFLRMCFSAKKTTNKLQFIVLKVKLSL